MTSMIERSNTCLLRCRVRISYPNAGSNYTDKTDLPDIPDHLGPEPNFSMFENGGLTRGFLDFFYHKPDAEGLSYAQRQELKEKALYEAMDKKTEAMILRDVESASFPCLHTPDCPGTVCKDMAERRRLAEEKYQRTIAELESSPKKKPSPVKGPPTLSSRNAVAALSELKPAPKFPQPAVTARVPDPTKPKQIKSSLPSTSILSRKKSTTTPLPINPSAMRHSAAVAASRTTIGYNKGRVTSSTLNRNTFAKPTTSTLTSQFQPQKIHGGKNLTSILKKEELDAGNPDITLSPALYIQRYGLPVEGSAMWFKCRDLGCFDDELEGGGEVRDGIEEGIGGINFLEEDALNDFQLAL